MQRGYESNGPDVKIRGNASHIAEKYITLARDALSSGDTVMAENYLQHAEHYNRIIASAQQAQEANGQGGQQHNANNRDHNNNNRDQNRDENDGKQRHKRGNRPEQAAEQPAEPKVAKEADAPAEDKPEKSKDEPAPKPRRKRQPRAKMAAPDEGEKASGTGPVRMGDIPMDETAG